MRTWMVDTRILCRKHLLGEHVECHMIVSVANSGRSLEGWIKKNCIDENVILRHDELAQEMKRRGYNHNSPINELKIPICATVDKPASLKDLISRCDECRKRYNDLSSKIPLG